MEFGIDRVVITPGDNPALPILREAIRRRAENDPEQYDTYRCRTYTKMELDLTNIRPGSATNGSSATSDSSSTTWTPRRSPDSPTCRP